MAWVCSYFSLPLLCVKAITDIVDGGRWVLDAEREEASWTAFPVNHAEQPPHPQNLQRRTPGTALCSITRLLSNHIPHFPVNTCPLTRRPSQEEFLENLSTAAGALQGALPKVLRFVAGKSVSEL